MCNYELTVNVVFERLRPFELYILVFKGFLMIPYEHVLHIDQQ